MTINPRPKTNILEVDIYDEFSIYEDEIDSIGGRTFSIDDVGGISDDFMTGDD